MTDICDRFKKLYTGLVYDILDGMGLPNQALATDMRPLRADMIVAGPAFTIQGINDPNGDPELRDRRIKLFKAMRHPCVDVRDCSFDTRVAHYGEMNAVLGRANGVVGAVIDGGIRDSRHLLEMNFPTISRYHSPVGAPRRLHVRRHRRRGRDSVRAA
jgi:regulator of RNase E activity RraA